MKGGITEVTFVIKMKWSDKWKTRIEIEIDFISKLIAAQERLNYELLYNKNRIILYKEKYASYL